MCEVYADISFGGKCARIYYDLDLLYCTLSTPVRKRDLIDIPLADGRVDLLRNLGEPRYESRTLRAEFRALGDVRSTLDRLFAELEGTSQEIVLPLDPDHYVIGDVHISSAGYFPGADIVITATCDPWRYSTNRVGEAIL